jgi:hypothetical protein
MNLDQIRVVKVEGAPYVRDVASMGLSNVDTNSRNEYYSKVALLKTQKNEINTIKSEVDAIKSDMQDIKQLLRQLLDKGTNG